MSPNVKTDCGSCSAGGNPSFLRAESTVKSTHGFARIAQNSYFEQFTKVLHGTLALRGKHLVPQVIKSFAAALPATNSSAF